MGMKGRRRCDTSINTHLCSTTTMAPGDHLVAGSDMNLEKLMEILAKNDRSYTLGTDPSKLKGIPSEKCISAGKGFSSKIYRILLEADDGSHSVLVKIAGPQKMRHDDNDEVDLDKLEMIASVHNREVAFYEFAKNNVPDDLLLVKYFHGTQMNVADGMQGLIVMEDLTGKMMKEYKLGQGVGVNAVLSIFDTLAVLQVRSLLHQEQIKEQFQHNSKALHAIHSYVVYCCKELEKRNLPWFTENISDKCQANADPSNARQLLSPDAKYGDLGHVLVHGDLWPNNMIWQGNGGKPDLLAICDWQCTHAGNYTADIAAVMAVSMDGDNRRANEENMLGFYTKQMNKNLEKHGICTRLNLDTVRASYKNSLNYAILQLIMTVVTNPKDDVPLDGEEEGPLTKRLRTLVEDMF
ncbi:hypothetical protein QR680_003602 [Steinernema hermaphroditum]|uniref:CHK kinase-like domain-containing protein n=1 Tax=Steinernema hermaphroditum TaxID=289476 RepID=A0AA39HLY3_9BILA|nr:hypothetical protein QR680_003602 [Steinernema hermaphroditum]